VTGVGGTTRTLAAMTTADAIERRLAGIGADLRRLREELRVADEELAHFRSDADDAQVRAVVSDDRRAVRDERDARRTVEAIARQRAHLAAEIDRLEAGQDDLLDQLGAARRAGRPS